jgi:ubiquinone/menaquinone biosynthesis C-methylase UbiE
MLLNVEHNEIERIDAIYTQRRYDTDLEYSDVNPIYLHRIHSMERATLIGLKTVGLDVKLSDLKVLDYGCGNGRWFGRWIAWGATPSNLTGVDLRANAIELASNSCPSCHFQLMVNGRIPFADASFDVVIQNLVFSSILDDNYRREAAREMMRVLKPNGILLWCDFTFNNPINANVKAVTKHEIRNLFSGFDEVVMQKVILAPPVARRLVPLSWLLADIAETCFPCLRTHIFAIFRKK